ncbi:MAG: ATP-dependent zinc metalloprotease FtsH [Gammaproteobacteria bacterium]|nr:ATP-dependent zinc metalloprotease FtsH [Gammaproteobacteria bacterium]MBQ0839986.1 ATP-dependent zinc metalloprotease FtsH [Gammaproteobacteria bacterium]
MPDEKKASDSEQYRRATRLTFLFLIVYLAVQHFYSVQPQSLSYTAFKEQVATGLIKKISIKNETITGEFSSSTAGTSDQSSIFKVILPPIDDPGFMPLLEEHQVEIEAEPTEMSVVLQLLIGIVPWLLLLAFFVYSSRMMQKKMGGGAGGTGGVFGFSRSKARRHGQETIHIGFDDVAGLDHAKQDLREIVDFLKNPDKYRSIGAKMPRGMLLMGAPGTGKTLLAKAAAGEAGVPFFSISGSEFIEMFVGVGASRVRDMFEQARKEAPAIIFIDEIDSVGRVRGTGMGGGNDEQEQTLNQILAEMDGFEADEAVLVLAATNRPDVLDPALLRPGRFDRKLVLELPEMAARQTILEVHTRKVPLSDERCLKDIAARTVGMSGADLENLVNEAALRAARDNREQVSPDDFEYARDRVVLGSEREEVLGEGEKQRVAYHEAGHGITAFRMQHSDPLRKISIIPRGRALGVTEQMPEEDRHNFTQEYLEERISILLGGRLAEQLIYGDVSTGAADDLKQATLLARKMVAQWGMSEALGSVSFPQSEEHPFLGRDIAQPRNFSEDTLKLIDREVLVLVRKCEAAAAALLQENLADLKRLATALLERETLLEPDIVSLLASPQTRAES